MISSTDSKLMENEIVEIVVVDAETMAERNKQGELAEEVKRLREI